MSKNWDESTLSSLRIHELRDLARKIGVQSPTSKKKEELVSQAMQILNGESEPYKALNKKGRPNKSETQVNTLMEFFMPEDVELESSVTYKTNQFDFSYYVGMPEIQYDVESNPKAEGYVEITANGVGIVRVNGFETSEDDIFIHEMIVSKNDLKTGDYVEAYVKRIIPQRPRAVVKIISVNKNEVVGSKFDNVTVNNKTYACGDCVLSLNSTANALQVFNQLENGVNFYVSAYEKQTFKSTDNKIYACVNPFKTYQDIFCCFNMAFNRAKHICKTSGVTMVINNIGAYYRALESMLCGKVDNQIKLDKIVREEIIKMLAIAKQNKITVFVFENENIEPHIKEFLQYELARIVDYVI